MAKKTEFITIFTDALLEERDKTIYYLEEDVAMLKDELREAQLMIE